MLVPSIWCLFSSLTNFFRSFDKLCTPVSLRLLKNDFRHRLVFDQNSLAVCLLFCFTHPFSVFYDDILYFNTLIWHLFSSLTDFKIIFDNFIAFLVLSLKNDFRSFLAFHPYAIYKLNHLPDRFRPHPPPSRVRARMMMTKRYSLYNE